MFIRSKPENGIDQDRRGSPPRGIELDRVLGHGQDDDRHADPALVELVDELEALDPALEQGIDDDDVGPELARSGRPPSSRR